MHSFYSIRCTNNYSIHLLSFPHLPFAHIFALKKQDMSDFSFIPPTSVVTIPGAHASAAFTAKTSEVFKEEHNIAPIIINDKMKYIPWGGDNQMPYNIIDLIESGETMSTCQMFNAEVCYGSGLVYDTGLATAQVQAQVDDFMLDNDLASYFLGVCQDFKHFGFCVSVIILNEDASRIVRIVRKQTCYVRFAPADKSGVIPYILYANWRNTVSPEDIERIELLNPQSPFTDLQTRSKKIKKFAIISRVPTPDSTYYPIPYYAALFKGKWFNIKQLIGIAKEAKLKNSAPIKYNIEIANSFWNNIFKVEGITDREYPIPSIIDIVNSIRLAKGSVFAEWKQSDTAKLFEDHGYKNKKQAGGYFF